MFLRIFKQNLILKIKISNTDKVLGKYDWQESCTIEFQIFQIPENSGFLFAKIDKLKKYNKINIINSKRLHKL